MATATLTRIGNSVGVAIPKELRTYGFELGDRVDIEYDSGSLKITPIKRRPTLKSLMRGYQGPAPDFIDPGEPVGKEVLPWAS